MQIDVQVLKEVIDSHVEDILGQIEGKYEPILPRINKHEAINKLGLISSIVISLHDKVEDPALQEEIWKLKKESDSLVEKLISNRA